jgi:hypothetical protein
VKGVGRPITSCHVPQQFTPLGYVPPVVTVRVSVGTSPLETPRKRSNRWAVSPRLLLCGGRASHHLLSRPATFQTATLCRPGGYCEGVGRPVTCCQGPQQLKPLRCVAPVVTVSVSEVPSHPVRSALLQTFGLCRVGGYCEGVGRPINFSDVPQQFKPMGCVVPVFTVKVSGGTSPPVTSRNSTYRWAVLPQWLL